MSTGIRVSTFASTQHVVFANGLLRRHRINRLHRTRMRYRFLTGVRILLETAPMFAVASHGRISRACLN